MVLKCECVVWVGSGVISFHEEVSFELTFECRY